VVTALQVLLILGFTTILAAALPGCW